MGRSCTVLMGTVLLVGAGCGDGSGTAGTTASLPSSSITTTVTTGAATLPSTTAAIATTITAAASTSPAAPACTVVAMMPALRDEFGPTPTEADVELRRCQNGHAQAYLSGGHETEQVFLGWSGGAWRVLEYGTGIVCDDPAEFAQLHEDTQAICTALGYPGPS